VATGRVHEATKKQQEVPMGNKVQEELRRILRLITLTVMHVVLAYMHVRESGRVDFMCP
jgi:hypothetical protein